MRAAADPEARLAALAGQSAIGCTGSIRSLRSRGAVAASRAAASTTTTPPGGRSRRSETPSRPREITASTGRTFSFTRIGIASFELEGVEHELELDWNDGYGGGLFLAFTDQTSGETTYGGGRYLIDTVKGADLGFDRASGTAVLDFNFAFNPSCSYDARWACPLAPPANRLPIPVTAGEQHVRRPELKRHAGLRGQVRTRGQRHVDVGQEGAAPRSRASVAEERGELVQQSRRSAG